MHKIVNIDIQFGDGFIIVNKLETPKEYRNQGLAREAMQELCEKADDLECIILLTPTNDWGSSVTRLKKFYRSLGFRYRKGYHELPSSSMIRLPKRYIPST